MLPLPQPQKASSCFLVVMNLTLTCCACFPSEALGAVVTLRSSGAVFLQQLLFFSYFLQTKLACGLSTVTFLPACFSRPLLVPCCCAQLWPLTWKRCCCCVAVACGCCVSLCVPSTVTPPTSFHRSVSLRGPGVDLKHPFVSR